VGENVIKRASRPADEGDTSPLYYLGYADWEIHNSEAVLFYMVKIYRNRNKGFKLNNALKVLDCRTTSNHMRELRGNVRPVLLTR